MGFRFGKVSLGMGFGKVSLCMGFGKVSLGMERFVNQEGSAGAKWDRLSE